MIDALWLEAYEKLNTSDKELFAREVNTLLSRTFLVRDRYDTAVDEIRSSAAYRFVDRHFDLFSDYLSLTGWHLAKDRQYGVIYIESDYGQNRLHLDLFQTLILYCLRLIYDEEREKLTLRNEIQTTPFEVALRLMNLESRRRKPSDKDLRTALRILSHHQIIQKIDGSWEDENARLLILPSILFVLPNQKIADVYRQLAPKEDAEEDAVPSPGEDESDLDETDAAFDEETDLPGDDRHDNGSDRQNTSVQPFEGEA
ncbi:MAG: DUF4194 domain-containing protein [Bacillota bacterium]|nr:DUF4194 domain-containing protein [Bacillota bacterium]